VLSQVASSDTFSRFQLRIVDGTGRVLVETPGMATILPIEAFPRSDAASDPVRARHSHGRRSFVLESVTLRMPAAHGASPRSAWQVEVALDVSAEHKVLSAYLRHTAGVLAAAVLLAALIGALIARRGLRPISDITRATERIGIEQLHERIGEAPWPRELTALAGAFDHMLERLQEAFEKLSQFSADLAHELRTPINNLMGEAQVALSHERTPREYIEVLQSALEEQSRLARMIDSMLFLAYADGARAAPALAALDARAEIEAVADFYQALAEEQGVELGCEGDGRLQADPQLLRRALSNLVSNALKYTPRGGRVTLRAGTGPRGEPALAVSDNGIGVAPEHLPRLGDRLYRADPARTGTQGGSGLGLSIVKSIMALHGGKLEIESTLGSGTRATLRFSQMPLSPRSDG
ncbi:MAG: heavy metal sensor histidine kinase, partial [Steroidobacteraceae bacterium]